MQSKYALLCSVYRYFSIYRTNVPREILQFGLLETNQCHTQKDQETLASVLKENYDIRNRETLLELLQKLEEDSYVLLPAAQILFSMYQQYGDSLQEEAVKTKALEHYGSSLFIRQTLERFHEGVVPVLSEDPKAIPLVVQVGNKLRELIDEKSKLGKRFLAFFAKHRPLMEAADGLLILGFDYSRMVEVLSGSGDLGYIDEAELQELLEYVGGHAERLFGSWVTFWASAVAGKLWMVDEQRVSGEYILPGSDYTSAIYGLASSPAKPLTSFGLWDDSDMERLRELLLPYIDQKEDKKNEELIQQYSAYREQYFEKCGFSPAIEGKSFLLALDLFIIPAQRNGVNYYLNEDHITREISFPMEDTGTDHVFWRCIAKWARRGGVTFERDEVPFMYAQRHIFTDKHIYRVRRSALFFNRVERIEWREAVFTFKPSGAGYISCYLGGKKFADLTFSHEHIGKTSSAQLFVMEDSELETVLADDLTALRTLFEHMVTKLSRG